MASTQGEIRVGPSHQARLPECEGKETDVELTKVREELRWMPAMSLDGDLLMYLRAARSMAAFAGMCDGGSADDGCIAASRDDTTINALDVLHDSGYDPGKALQALVKCPVPKGIDKKWGEDEIKRFVKGLRQFGKNFFRIRKDLLPHKDTPELVEFYYLWKKTPGANNNRPHRRRRQGSLRRIRGTRNSPRAGTPKDETSNSGVGGSSRPSPNPNDKGEGSSGSDDDDEGEDDSDSRENGPFRCQHCFSNNCRDLEPVCAKERLLVCTECRAYYKKYGELPPTSSTNPSSNSTQSESSRNETPYLFRPVGSPDRVRTRNKSKDAVKGDTPTKVRKRESEEEEVCVFKRKREGGGCESPAESLTADSGSVSDLEDNEGTPPVGVSSASKSSKIDREDDPSLLTDDNTIDEASNLSLPPPPAKTPETTFDQVKTESPLVKEESFKSNSSNFVPSPTEQKPLELKLDLFSVPIQISRTVESSSPSLIHKPFDSSLSQGKLTVKKEGLFDSSEGGPPQITSLSSNTTEEHPTHIISSVTTTPTTTTAPLVSASRSSTVTSNNLNSPISTPLVKVEPGLNEESLGNERLEMEQPASQNDNSSSNRCNSVSPIALTVYPQNSPGHTETKPITSTSNQQPQSILMPAYPPIPEGEKITLNIPSVGNQQFTPFYHPHFSPRIEKPPAPSPPYLSGIQSEPQNLKIKLEEPDPLQSLKEVKVPGYSPTSVSQPLLPTTTAQSTHSPHSPFIDTIKKEPEFGRISTPPKSPVVVRATEGSSSSVSAPTPPFCPTGRLSQLPHPHAYVPHHLMHPSLLHAAGVHPYAQPFTYPYPFAYPPYPIPQPIPPRHDKALEQVISQQSSSMTRKEIETREDVTQEITQTTHHQTTTMLHHPHADKQTTLSHHTSSSTTQHKINKMTNNPSTQLQQPSQGGSVHTMMSQTTSLSTSHGPMHHHHHIHSHLQSAGPTPPTTDRLSPSTLLLPTGVRKSQLPTNSLEALRAHAQAAALQSSLPLADEEADEEEAPSPTSIIPRGPTPDPKIEDSECHRSQSAIFLRHWNRGDYNSCCRTDLTFKPVPDSKLARKREERIRKQAEKEREERDKVQARKVAVTPDKTETSSKAPPQGPIETTSSPYDRFTSRANYSDPAVLRLGDYGRPHSGFSPVGRCIDPTGMSLQYSLYGGGRELEQLEREKRERELRELRERELSDRLKEELLKSAAVAAAAASQPSRGMPLDPHWLDIHRRYQGLGPHGLPQFGLFPPAPAAQPPSLSQIERDRLERIGGPSGYSRPGSLLAGRDGLPLHHPSDLLSRPPYVDPLAHQAAAAEHLQRQMLMERERFPHPLVAQHEEFIRQQRERELKIRALEEATRGSRQ